jgi:catechol 2,3-dioxygenase-like lactoylglutathione lyase family enzyme
MLSRPRYVIAVHDLARSAAYYRDVLGFDVLWPDVPGWRLFVRDECRIMAGECPDAPPAGDLGDHSYFAYLQVDAIDDFYAAVTSRGAVVVKPLRDEPWGMREFGLRTVDGHRIMFALSIRDRSVRDA